MRRNIGKHVIISGESHETLRRACAEVDVKISEVADFAVRKFNLSLVGMGAEDRQTALRAAAERSELRKERGKIVAPSEEEDKGPL